VSGRENRIKERKGEKMERGENGRGKEKREKEKRKERREGVGRDDGQPEAALTAGGAVGSRR